MSKYRWPFDAAITIALCALIFSIVQFALSSPLLLNLYFQPKLEITDFTNHTDDTSIVGFRLKNSGWSNATEVQVGVISHENDMVSLMPLHGAIITNDGAPFGRNFLITIPYMAAGEVRHILVRKGKVSMSLDKEAVTLNDDIPAQLNFPVVNYLRSKEGLGQIKSARELLTAPNNSMQPTANASAD